MLKKIGFFICAGFFAIAVIYLQYNTYRVEYVMDLYNSYIDNEEYGKVATLFNYVVDTNSIVDEKNDNGVIEIYPGIMPVSATYKENAAEVSYVMYENAYHLYLFNSKYSFNDITSDDKVTNYSSIRFNSSTAYYDYFLIQNEDVNASSYIAEPKTKEEALLNCSIDYLDIMDSLGFLSLDFTYTEITEIENRIGNIESISIMSNEQEAKYTFNVSLDFNEAFFTDSAELLNKHNQMLNEYENSQSDNERKEIKNNLIAALQEWENQYCVNDSLYYVNNDEFKTPASVYWKLAGPMAIFILVTAFLYVIFFMRKQLKRLFNRLLGNTNEEEEPITPNKEQVMIGDVPYDDFAKFVIPDEEEEVKEEKQEETKE